MRSYVQALPAAASRRAAAKPRHNLSPKTAVKVPCLALPLDLLVSAVSNISSRPAVACIDAATLFL